MKILLLGSNGFLGKSTYNKLTDHNVINANIDITNINNFNILPKNFDIVINCAAKIPIDNQTESQNNEMFNVNVNGTQNIVNWIKNNNVPHLIHCSTLSIITRPDNKYSISKKQAENIIINNLQNYTILRFSAIYGETMKWHGVIPKFIDAALNDKLIQSTKNVYADFIHIDDASKAIILSLNKIHGIINVASGIDTSIYNLANLIIKLTNSFSKLENISSELFKYTTDVYRMTNELKINKLTSLEDGLKKLIEFRKISNG